MAVPCTCSGTWGHVGRNTLAGTTGDLAERFRRFVAGQQADVMARLEQQGRDTVGNAPTPSEELVADARTIVPTKAFPGYLGWEWIQFVPQEEREAFLEATGEQFSWCAPGWMQMALFWSNGHRDLLEIHDRMRVTGDGVELKRLLACIEGLARHGYVTLS